MNDKPSSASIFDPIAEAYDCWSDSREGQAIFQEEVLCLQQLGCDYSNRWLEIGVGTGRFAKAIGIKYGIDLSLAMAVIAKRRGIAVQVGSVEQLPFQESAFDGILMALTLCFGMNPEQDLSECARVVRDKGHLVIGTIPADSPWGSCISRKNLQGPPSIHTPISVLSLQQ